MSRAFLMNSTEKMEIVTISVVILTSGPNMGVEDCGAEACVFMVCHFQRLVFNQTPSRPAAAHTCVELSA